MLQALYLLPKFREVVYQIPSDADDRGAKIGFALRRVFYALQTGSRGVSTKQPTSSFGWGSIENFVQHDVQEVRDDKNNGCGRGAWARHGVAGWSCAAQLPLTQPRLACCFCFVCPSFPCRPPRRCSL